MNLLVNHHSLPGALQVMGNLLQNLKHQMFMHVAADNAFRAIGASKLMVEYFDTSTFGVISSIESYLVIFILVNIFFFSYSEISLLSCWIGF